MKFGTGFRRTGLASLTQLIASLYTFFLTAASASQLSAQEFGLFSIAFAVYALLQGIFKGVFTEPAIYHPLTSTRQGASPVIGATSAMTLVSTLPFVVFGVIAFWVLPEMLQWVAIFSMSVVVFFSVGHFRYMAQLANREVCAVLAETAAIVSLLVSFSLRPVNSLSGIIVVWVLSMTVAMTIYVCVLGMYRPGLILSRWSRTYLRGGQYFAGDYLATNSMSQGSILIVGLLGGPALSGSIRAAQVLMTPLLVVTRGLLSALGPLMNRIHARRNYRRIVRLSVGYSVACFLGGTATFILVSLLDVDVIRFVLGESADAALVVFPWVVVSSSAVGIAGGAALGLRALGQIRLSFRLKLITLPLGFGGLLVGLFAGGAAGSQAGIAFSEAVRAVLNWFSLRKEIEGKVGKPMTVYGTAARIGDI